MESLKTAPRRNGSRAKAGPKAAAALRLLKRYESRNVTFIDPDKSWPIVWERAQGVHVWDLDGKKYLDLTAAFGVAAAGHANPRVVRAGQLQMGRLLHAMGDVHPHRLKGELARELSRITFERWTRGRTAGKAIFCNSGFEAVEAALKTAALRTGKPGVFAFSGGYHGLGYGALNVTHRSEFSRPFLSQLTQFGHFLHFHESPVVPTVPPPSSSLEKIEAEIRQLHRTGQFGAILIEPLQGRGGIRLFPKKLFQLLRRLSDELQLVLIFDEIFTGFGRTGKWFACEHYGIIPDLICLGKALTGGFPLSVCLGKAGLMDVAWPESTGEALHTSTFLGHPVGCAMALAQIAEIRSRKLVERSAKLGKHLLALLRNCAIPPQWRAAVRGLGLMAGLELTRKDGSPAGPEALRIIQAMLMKRFVLLPEGEHGNVISFTPPLVISEQQLTICVRTLEWFMRELASND